MKPNLYFLLAIISAFFTHSASSQTFTQITDPNNPAGATNYCINASLQAYNWKLNPIGHNIRISLHTWDPQLNSLKPSGIGAFEGFIGDSTA